MQNFFPLFFKRVRAIVVNTWLSDSREPLMSCVYFLWGQRRLAWRRVCSTNFWALFSECLFDGFRASFSLAGPWNAGKCVLPTSSGPCQLGERAHGGPSLQSPAVGLSFHHSHIFVTILPWLKQSLFWTSSIRLFLMCQIMFINNIRYFAVWRRAQCTEYKQWSTIWHTNTNNSEQMTWTKHREELSSQRIFLKEQWKKKQQLASGISIEKRKNNLTKEIASY